MFLLALLFRTISRIKFQAHNARALIHTQQIHTRKIAFEWNWNILWQAKSKNKSISDENEINMSTTSVQATSCTLSTPFHSPPSNLSSNHHENSLLSLYFVYWIKFELNFHNDMALVVSISLSLSATGCLHALHYLPSTNTRKQRRKKTIIVSMDTK